MLDKLRVFSKGKLATVLVAIIIIPFVFWGMGSVFSGGNTNSVAKINNYNISTNDFVKHINNSKINNDIIRENIDNNILEDLLRDLVSSSIIDIEIKDLNLIVSDKILAKLIKKNKIFLDSDQNFSRTKYEKFLLENNLTATQFEYKFKNNHLKKNLFQYVSGGIKTPYFMINKIYKNQTKKINISYIDLNNVYKKKDSFTKAEIDEFINNNIDKLKVDYIDFSYAKLTPNNLSESNEFTDDFFSKIDSIENETLNGKKLKDIASSYNFEIVEEYNYFNNKKDNQLFSEIYEKRNDDNVQLIDKNDYFLIYEIKEIKNKLPNRDKNFINTVVNNMFEMKKYEVNKDFFEKIQNKKLTFDKFNKVVENKNLINKISISSINDNEVFSDESLKLLYSMSKNSFLLMSDKKNTVYLAYINNIYSNDIVKNDSMIDFYADQSIIQIKDNLYNSYDFIINDKYKVKLNQKTLQRLKNHFK